MDDIKLTYFNDDEEEVVLSLPSIMEVCDDCGGQTYVLCEGMRDAAYSAEEFYESFDDEEDREAYFTRGGKYDVLCPTCGGKNVVPSVDEDRLTPEQKVQYAEYQKYQEHQWQLEYDSREESRMERMMGC